MQNQVYSRYLYQMLMEYGSVSVPSLGTFVLHPSESTFNGDRSVLGPPKTQLNFSSDINEDTILSKRLVDAGMSFDDAILVQDLIVQDYAHSKSNQLPFEIGDFGTVINHIFLEKDKEIFNKFRGLTPISTKALPPSFVENKPKDAASLYFAGKKTTYDDSAYVASYIWPILLSILTGLVILYWFLSSGNTSKIPVVVPKPVELTENVMPAIDTTAEKIDTISTKISNSTDDTAKVNETPDLPKSAPITKQKAEQPVTAKESSKYCVVIIGAFQESSNADKMIKKIHAKGYKTYTEQKNGLNRVGISYDCTKKDPDAFKAKVKKMFDKDAWHLHDTL